MRWPAPACWRTAYARKSIRIILMPSAAVPFDQCHSRGRPPSPRRIGLGQIGRFCPCVKDGTDPTPRRFHFVAAHEQGLVATHHIEDEALIGIRMAHAKCLG